MDRLIGPALQSIPAAPGAPAREPRELPDDMLDESRKRLSVISFIGSILWFVGTVAYHLARRAIAPDDPLWRQFSLPDAIALVNILASLAFCSWTRRSKKSPAAMLQVALYYMVLTSFSVSVIWHRDPAMHSEQIIPTITWVGVVVMLFAAILPFAPRKTVIVGLICVAMKGWCTATSSPPTFISAGSDSRTIS